MHLLTRIPGELIGIPNLPPTAGITGARSGKCTDADLERRTAELMSKVESRSPINEFNRIWTNIPASKLIKQGYLPGDEDNNVWIHKSDNGVPGRPLAMKLSDGRYMVDPQAIGWDDINRFNEALKGGQGVFEDTGSYLSRCLRALMGIPVSKDQEVLTYRKALEKMLDAEDQSS